MKIIPYDFIVSLQQDIDNMSPIKSQNKMKEVYLDQPNLTHFIVELNEDLDDELNKYVLYLFSLIYLAVKEFYQISLPAISVKDIIKIHENNMDFFESLQTSHEVFINKIAEINLNKQPGIYQFITESIFEDLKDMFDIGESEEGWIFIVLKSAIDVLNEKID